MTYMPADNIRNRQQQIDQRFHEYKLAALTGLMSQWNPDNFTDKDAASVAHVCERAAQAMEEFGQDESGDGP